MTPRGPGTLPPQDPRVLLVRGGTAHANVALPPAQCSPGGVVHSVIILYSHPSASRGDRGPTRIISNLEGAPCVAAFPGDWSSWRQWRGRHGAWTPECRGDPDALDTSRRHARSIAANSASDRSYTSRAPTSARCQLPPASCQLFLPHHFPTSGVSPLRPIWRQRSVPQPSQVPLPLWSR